jgi:hypothetical protein
MFLPKISNARYISTGLGNLAREVVTSYEPRLKTSIPIESRLTLIAAASARNNLAFGRGNAEICKSIAFGLHSPYKIHKRN